MNNCGKVPKKSQKGGSWLTQFYSVSAVGGVRAITEATLAGINNSPMFKPFDKDAKIPTMPSIGIIPMVPFQEK